MIEAIKEIRNYLFIGRTLKKASKSDEWKKLKLRRGWFNVVYTLVNLPPEVFESEAAYYQAYVIEELKPINAYLESLNLAEVVSLEVRDVSNPEEGVYAYLAKYEPLFKEFSLWFVIKWTFLISLTTWLTVKFSLIEQIINGFNLFLTWLK